MVGEKCLTGTIDVIISTQKTADKTRETETFGGCEARCTIYRLSAMPFARTTQATTDVGCPTTVPLRVITLRRVTAGRGGSTAV